MVAPTSAIPFDPPLAPEGPLRARVTEVFILPLGTDTVDSH